MTDKKTITISGNQTASFHKTSQKDLGTIFYLHGGGLIYGDKDDLPIDYIKQFTDNGYNFFSLSYLLAPESNYKEIITSVLKGYDWLNNNISSLSNNNKVYVFGRSAGAYLCYQIIMNRPRNKPSAFLDFYGFYNLLDSNLVEPNHFYSKYPNVDIHSLQEPHPIFSGDINKRFPIYLYARKQGSWIRLLKANSKEQKNIDFNKLPPTFIAHSTQDPDIPFIIALSEKSKNRRSFLKSIDSNQHDFDRIVTEENINLYSYAIKWLSEI